MAPSQSKPEKHPGRSCDGVCFMAAALALALGGILPSSADHSLIANYRDVIVSDNLQDRGPDVRVG